MSTKKTLSIQQVRTYAVARLWRGLFRFVLALSSIVVTGCPNQSKPGNVVDSGAGQSVSPATSNKIPGEGATEFQTSKIRFSNVTPPVVRSFSYRNGEDAGHYSLVESLGGGIALFDFDVDGRLDIFAPGGGYFSPQKEILGHAPCLFRGMGDWQFTNVTGSTAMAFQGYYSHGACVGDFNNDGFPDMLVTGYGGLQLFRNQGDGTFQETAARCHLQDELWSSSSAWTDIDRDGDLDLYVAHYLDWSFENDPKCKGPRPGTSEICPPRRFKGLPDTFFINTGDGRFEERTADIGLQAAGKGLGVLSADFDLDGDSDIYVTNDTQPNFVFRNDGAGQLEDISLTSGASLSENGGAEGSMGITLGDYNLDGLPDLWVANFERESFALYRNQGNCFFQRVSQITGVTAISGLYVGWGTVFFDADRDMDEDIFVSNGHVIRHPTNAPLRQLPLMLENTGERFRDVAAQAGRYLRAEHMGRGVAAGDIDNDGDVDLAVSHINGPLALLSNESQSNSHWIAIRLVGTRSSRDAIGAWVSVRTNDGPKQIRHRIGGGSYASSSDSSLNFGLGDATIVETIEVHWPTGSVESLRNVPANHVLTIVEATNQRTK